MSLMRINPLLIAAAALALIALLLASGCQPTGIRFVDDAASYDAESVTQLVELAVPGSIASAATEDAARLRQDALADLRGQGGAAAEAAELLTATFSASTVGVPYYVERASYEGVDVLLVMEARGPSGGELSGRRLWVLGLDGSVILSRLFGP